MDEDQKLDPALLREVVAFQAYRQLADPSRRSVGSGAAGQRSGQAVG